MSDLIPESAWDAAYDSADDNFYTDGIVNAAAPHIAAHALRKAARMIEPGKVRPADAISSFRYGDLMRLADEIEANTAFTDMVQLGQEIERGK